MKARSSKGSGGGVKLAIGVIFLVLIFVGGAIGGQYVGGFAFASLEKLPPSIVGPMTLYRYWTQYSDVQAVRRHLLPCLGLSLFATLLPLAVVLFAVFAKVRARELHGSARFASLLEIRKSGLVGRGDE